MGDGMGGHSITQLIEGKEFMKKTIGIIGGMGPLATVDLFSKIVRLTKAEKDSDHLHILIDNDTNIPSRMDAILRGGPDPSVEMCKSAVRLEKAGAEILIIGCNTAHYYYPAVRAAVRVPILNMLEVTADEVVRRKIKKVGLLATDAVMNLKLYEDALLKRKIEVIKPNAEGQEAVMQIIFQGVKAGKTSYDTERFLKMLSTLQAQGAGTVILGCTELPLAFQLYGIQYPSLDPTAVLAAAAIRAAGGETI